MMRLTRKLYSEPEDEEDENDEKTWKRRRNIGIIGAGTGATVFGLGRGLEKGKSGVAKRMFQDKMKEELRTKQANGSSKTVNNLKLGGGILMAGGAILATGSEIKRRKLKKKHDENKA